MNFSQFLLILKARFKIILLTFVTTVTITLVVSLLIPKSYTATTSLILNYKGMDPVTGIALPAQLMPGYMATQVDIITSQNVAVKVVDALKFTNSTQAQAQFQEATQGRGDIRNWFAGLLLKKLDVQPSRESSVIELSFTGADPEFAAIVANAFAVAYQETSLQLKTAPAQIASTYLGTQTKVLRENLKVAQTNLSAYQQENGITSGIEQFDAESAKLNELTAQLVAAQGNAIEASSRQNGTRGNAEQSPDVAANPLVQSLKVQISSTDAKLADIAQRLGQNHPQYQSAKAEADKIKSEYQEALRNATANVGGTARIHQQREGELRAQVAAQKTKVLALNRTRDQLALLQKDVDNAQRALEAVNQRFTQTSLEGQGNQTDVGILNPAVPPIKHSSPKTLVNLILAIFLGTLLGVGFALLAELLDRRVRSADDIQEGVAIPVLGVIVSDSLEQPRRRRFIPLLRSSKTKNSNYLSFKN
ncbi:chain length determinant protein EpsF [Methylotenera mobilis]|uniref:Chain length determinant protein EpsF n=1 Tax=Methylotenera mobilis (strain JLW8 / ATCC BAA-1282 / DSM 17540) TaxID=583345 RepID=C6WXQ0_METML|nr:chain length determinant protein EpsF [Methylotenera mobilis]ACT48699.1 chain length determinant protein EpsF [Methylotenera mobilis JLW8]